MELPEFDIRLLSLNVRGLNDTEKRQSIFRWFKAQNQDVISLQETYSGEKNEQLWNKEWGSQCVYLHGTNHSCGLMILFSESLDLKIKNTIKDSKGRFILLKVLIQDTEFTLLNCYIPNKPNEQLECFDRIQTLMGSQKIEKNEFSLMGGDFNVTLQQKVDKKGGKFYESKKKY